MMRLSGNGFSTGTQGLTLAPFDGAAPEGSWARRQLGSILLISHRVIARQDHTEFLRSVPPSLPNRP